ncbi:MAG: M20/M25/M40 family metallo-hydrolase [Planctomycetota bacterium]
MGRLSRCLTLTSLCLLLLTESDLAVPGVPAQDEVLRAARNYYLRNGGKILREYAEFLRLPNVASDPHGLRRNATWIREALRRRDVAALLVDSEGAPPVVLGLRLAEEATRTLGLYAHYDGQPVDAMGWKHSPWQAVLYTRPMEEGGVPRDLPGDGEALDREWRLYARSAADDKAPIMAILAALDALREAGTAPRSNLIFLFEGEEESGSPDLGRFLEREREMLAADIWLILDGPVHTTRRPQLVFGVRGIAVLDITVYGANRPLHSGHYGNWAPNPAMRLAQLLSSMVDSDGRVTIDGFYDTTVPLELAAREAAAALGESEDGLRRELGLKAAGNDDASYLDTLLRPSLNVRGLQAAAVGKAASNVIPAIATASIDIRLARGNDPQAMLDLVENHIRKQGYHIVRGEPTATERLSHAHLARIDRGEGYPAAHTALDAPLALWLRRQVELVAGAELVLMPTMGGSLPLHLFECKLGTPIVIVPIVNHDNNQHAANENLRLANLEYGIVLLANLLAAE